MVTDNILFGAGLAGQQDIMANIGNLTAGAITVARMRVNEIIRRNAAAVSFSTPLEPDEDVFFILNEGGELIRSNNISPNFNWSLTAYAAPVVQVGTIGGVAVSTLPLVANIADYLGGYFSLSIINLSLPVEDSRRYRNYEVRVELGDTIASLVTGLVAEIQADADRIVNAAVVSVVAGNEEISLTAITAGVGFSAIPGDIMRDMPVDDVAAATAVVANVVGVGLPAQLTAYAEDAATHLGYNSQSIVKDNLHSRDFTVPVPAVGGNGYDVYVLQWTARRDDKLGSVDQKPVQELLIAVDNHVNFNAFRAQLVIILEIIRLRTNAAFA